MGDISQFSYIIEFQNTQIFKCLVSMVKFLKVGNGSYNSFVSSIDGSQLVTGYTSPDKTTVSDQRVDQGQIYEFQGFWVELGSGKVQYTTLLINLLNQSIDMTFPVQVAVDGDSKKYSFVHSF